MHSNVHSLYFKGKSFINELIFIKYMALCLAPVFPIFLSHSLLITILGPCNSFFYFCDIITFWFSTDMHLLYLLLILFYLSMYKPKMQLFLQISHSFCCPSGGLWAAFPPISPPSYSACYQLLNTTNNMGKELTHWKRP